MGTYAESVPQHSMGRALALRRLGSYMRWVMVVRRSSTERADQGARTWASIAASSRDTSVPEPSRDDIFNTGLLLQAGLRALLPVQERQGTALPGTPSPSDPSELIAAQENYKAVFESGADATPAQKATAIKSIALAAQQLRKGGYTLLAGKITDWLARQ
jgi:hypothetical protein